jgi:hypothetical protein
MAKIRKKDDTDKCFPLFLFHEGKKPPQRAKDEVKKQPHSCHRQRVRPQ